MSVFKGHDDLSLNRYYYSFYSFSQDDPNTIKSFVYDQNQTLVSSKDISFNTRNIPDMLSFLENSQSNPYALGKSNDEFLNMDITFAGLYKKALTETQQQSLMTSINKTYKIVYSNVFTTYKVKVVSTTTTNLEDFNVLNFGGLDQNGFATILSNNNFSSDYSVDHFNYNDSTLSIPGFGNEPALIDVSYGSAISFVWFTTKVAYIQKTYTTEDISENTVIQIYYGTDPTYDPVYVYHKTSSQSGFTQIDSTKDTYKHFVYTINPGDTIRIEEEYNAVLLYAIVLSKQTTVNSIKYSIDDVEQPNLEALLTGNYKFDQSDPSNDGHLLKFRSLGDSTSYTTNVIHQGTPGTPDSYTLIDVTQSTPDLEYYCQVHTESMYGEFKTPTDLPYYTVKVETNIVGDSVFAIQSPGQSAYVLQPDLSFNIGDLVYFYVGDDSMADISLVFGPTVDDTASMVGSPHYVKMGDIIRLDLTSGYTGDPLVYFEDSSAGMGYNMYDVSVETSFTTVSTASNPYNITCSSNGQYVYSKSGSNILKSIDYGLTYNVINTPISGNGIITSEDGQNICIWDGSNFATSTDYGNTFSSVNTSIQSISAISITGQYICRLESKKLHVSNNYGATFTELISGHGLPNFASGLATIYNIKMSTSGQYIMISANEFKGVIVSDNYGASFSLNPVTGGGTGDNYGRSIYMSPNGRCAIHLGGGDSNYNPYIYTNDYGVTWYPITVGSGNQLPITPIETDVVYFSYDGTHIYYIDTSDSNKLYYSNDSGLTYSHTPDTRFSNLFSLCADNNGNIHSSVNGANEIKRLYSSIPPIYNVTVSGEPFVFYLSGIPQPNISFTSGTTYVFDQSHASNANNTLVIGTAPDISSSIVSSGLTIMGTPGQPGAYTKYVSDGSTVYYFSYQTENMGEEPLTYTVKVVDHEVTGEKVFSFKAPGTSTFINQPDLSFGAGDRYQFDVTDSTMTDISLVFGTTVDDISTRNESVVSRYEGMILLDISAGYDGDRLVYFEDSSAGMGYKAIESEGDTLYTTNLELHIDASQYNYTDGQTLNITDASINDISPAANTLDSVDGDLLFTNVSNRKAIEFRPNAQSDGYERLVYNVPGGTFPNAFTSFVVYEAETDSNPILYSRTNANEPFHCNNTNTISIADYGRGWKGITVEGNTSGTIAIQTITYNPNLFQYTLGIDGETFDGSVNPISTFEGSDYNDAVQSKFYIGDRVNYQGEGYRFFNGKIFEFLIFSEANMDNDTKISIQTYLSKKWITQNLVLPAETHTVTVYGEVFYIDDSATPQLTFTSGTAYVFDQSHASNIGNTLVIGSFDVSSSIVSSGLTIMGTPGQPGAYTKYVSDGSTVHYFSYQTENMGTASPPPNITDDLYVHYDFELPLYDSDGNTVEGTGGGYERIYNKAYDSITNSDISYNAYVAGYGGGVTLNSTIYKIGSSSVFVNASNIRNGTYTFLLNSTQGYSVAFWMKEDTVKGPLFSLSNNSGPNTAFFYIDYNATDFIVHNNGKTITSNISALTMTDWNHIAFTMSSDGLTWKLYINGTLVQTKTDGNYLTSVGPISGYPTDSVWLVDIGGNAGNTSCKCYFDDFRFYKTELDQAQVSAVYSYTG